LVTRDVANLYVFRNGLKWNNKKINLIYPINEIDEEQMNHHCLKLWKMKRFPKTFVSNPIKLCEVQHSFIWTWMMFVVYLHFADASLHSTALWSQLDLFSGNAGCVCVVCWPGSCSVFVSFLLFPSSLASFTRRCETHVVAPHHFNSLREF